MHRANVAFSKHLNSPDVVSIVCGETFIRPIDRFVNINLFYIFSIVKCNFKNFFFSYTLYSHVHTYKIHICILFKSYYYTFQRNFHNLHWFDRQRIFIYFYNWYLYIVRHRYVRSELPSLRKTESRLLPYRKALLNNRRIPLLNTHVEHVYICCLLACLPSLRHDHHDRDEHAGGVKHTTPSYSPNMIVSAQYVRSVTDSLYLTIAATAFVRCCKSALRAIAIIY